MRTLSRTKTKSSHSTHWKNLSNRSSNHRCRSRNRRLICETLETRQLLAGNIYDDGLEEGWQNWSWGTTVDFESSAEIFEGAASAAVSHDEAWGGYYLSNPNAVATHSGDQLEFAIHGGQGGQSINLFVVDGGGNWLDAGSVAPTADQWNEITIDLDSLGRPDMVNGLVWQNATASSQSTFYIDSVNLGGGDGQVEIVETIYDDNLASGWQNWSWATSTDFANPSPLHSGTASVEVTHDEAWGGFFLNRDQPLTTENVGAVEFSIQGSTGGETVGVFVVSGNNEWLSAGEFTLQSGAWTNIALSLEALGAPSAISGFVVQDASGAGGSRYFVDDILLTAKSDSPPTEPNEGPQITLDPSIVLGTISEDIYGLNFADDTLAADIGLPIERWGGNATSRYNFELDSYNVGSDWYFLNVANENSDPGSLPNNSAADRFVSENQARGADSLMTIGMLGWVSNSREKAGSFSVEKYGPQQDVEPYDSNIGNGVRLDGSFVTGNDPTDTGFAVDETFAQEWVQHLVSQFGTAENGGVNFYALDNEPMLWNSTHRDVHPEPASYDEVLGKGITYAAAIKQIDPSANILGPTVWGWPAYFYSALDAAGEGAWWENPQDQIAHDGLAFLPWYLQAMASAEQQTGQRLLDYLDIHYYPQGEGIALTTGGGTLDTQQRRLESTRSLWDAEYTDESWINDQVNLIPRMRDWIDTYYPGTKLAITEYNFGATEHINGAVTQADVLGIFGREGVDLATMWGPPDADDPAGFAFRMYRNYDGQLGAGSMFGETSIEALTTDSDEVSVFASRRAADGALTVMLINKSTNSLTTPLQLPSEFGNFDAEVYSYDDTNLSAIERRPDLAFEEGAAEIDLPGYSITLIEIPPTEDANQPPTAVDDAYEVEEGVLLSVVAAGVLANDSDADNDPMAAQLQSGTANGQLSLSGDGSFTYVPDAGFSGVDQFVYVAFDGQAVSAPATVIITVTEAEPPTSFSLFTVDNRRTLHEYDDAGNEIGVDRLSYGNFRPRGLAATDDGSMFWTLNQAGEVFLYGRNGEVQGNWQALGLSKPEGITLDGEDLLIVDRGNDRVHRFDNATSRVSGVAEADFVFQLDRANRVPMDLTTNGNLIWTIDSTKITDRVFVYERDGTLLGSWSLDPDNTRPAGMAISPLEPRTIWVTDILSDEVFVYSGATGQLGGEAKATDRFALAERNSLAHGVAITEVVFDPPSTFGNDGSDAIDVNLDGFLSPIDALLVVNRINVSDKNSGEAISGLARSGLPDANLDERLDVNRDGYITALDALIVINSLNTPQTPPNSASRPEVEIEFFGADDQTPQAFEELSEAELLDHDWALIDLGLVE